jgi:hypothetical protein
MSARENTASPASSAIEMVTQNAPTAGPLALPAAARSASSDDFGKCLSSRRLAAGRLGREPGRWVAALSSAGDRAAAQPAKMAGLLGHALMLQRSFHIAARWHMRLDCQTPGWLLASCHGDNGRLPCAKDALKRPSSAPADALLGASWGQLAP